MTKAIANISITKPFSILSSATVIAFVLLANVLARAAADNLATCDRLAARPDDEDRPTAGSYDIARADVSIALKTCKAAVSAADAPRRAWFELGRGYEFNGQTAEAAKAYRKAAGAGESARWLESGRPLVNDNGVKKMRPKRASCS